jgi:uncharacterized protein YdeI (YjbR/CyaY-like superfamily)
MTIKFFKSPGDFRKWIEKHHASSKEQWVGFYKKGSGHPSITWPESVDQALCFGWIDGLRKTIDDASYKIRFTPRRPGSIWSSINVRRAEELSKDGLMHPAGLKAFGLEVNTNPVSTPMSKGSRSLSGVRKRLKQNKAPGFFHTQLALSKQVFGG